MKETRDLIIGEIAAREGLVTPAQLEDCLRQQIDERYARPLGEIMMERGIVGRDTLGRLLEVQRAAIDEFERRTEASGLFGRIAAAKGFITEEQRTQAVRAQIRLHTRGGRAKIGQIMLEMGLLDIQRFWEVLREQGEFRCGNCKAVLQNPWFRGMTVLCEDCKTPAFTVSADSPGPKPTRRRRRS